MTLIMRRFTPNSTQPNAVFRFIVTVATMGIFRGLVSLPTGGLPAVIEDETWNAIGYQTWLGLPVIIWIVIALFGFNYVLLAKTVFGRRAYLTGGNREAALYSGIRVNGLKAVIFVISGVMAAVSGILLSARLGSARPTLARGTSSTPSRRPCWAARVFRGEPAR